MVSTSAPVSRLRFMATGAKRWPSLLGEILAGTTRVPRVAEALQAISPAKTPSIERRLAALLANNRIEAESLWRPLLEPAPALLGVNAGVRTGWNRTRRSEPSALYLGLLVHSRLLPVSWQVMPIHEHWEQGQWTVVGTLLDRVIPHLGAVECTLLADRGLVGLPLVQLVLKLCQARGWHFVLRLLRASIPASRTRVGGPDAGSRVAASSLSVGSSGSVQPWSGRTSPARLHQCGLGRRSSVSPGFCPPDRPAGRHRVQEYARRMRVESTFEDLKLRGWDLEGTVIAERARLDRLLLVLFLSLWWLAHLAASCVHHGQRDRFDRLT